MMLTTGKQQSQFIPQKRWWHYGWISYVNFDGVTL